MEFYAPECWKQSGTSSTQCYSGRQVDVFAAGITIYLMCFNEFPYPTGKGVDIQSSI